MATTAQEKIEIHKHTKEMSRKVNVFATNMVSNTSTTVVTNVLMNVGVELAAKALAFSSSDEREHTFEQIMRAIAFNSQVYREQVDTSRAEIETDRAVNKAKGANHG